MLAPAAEGFFDSLASGTPPNLSPKTDLGPADGAAAAVAGGKAAQAVGTPRTPKDRPVIDGPPGEGEQDIQRALFVGNYPAALDACLKASCSFLRLGKGIRGLEFFAVG